MAEVTSLILKVADLAGTATDPDAVETWLLDGARQISKHGKTAGRIGEFATLDTTLVGTSASANVDEKYDIITCWHSLEHIHEPWVYLDKIRTHLNPEGVLVVALPNYNSTDANRYGSGWAAYDTPRHLYHFTTESMEKIASSCGFSIQSMHRMNFDSFYVSILSSQHIGKSFISGVLNGFISWLSAMFNREKCSSLIYIMK